MGPEKHLESLKEVLDEINSALEDSRGIGQHQRRLALMFSLGICDLIELYFHKLGIIKGGARIKHDWFRQIRIKEKLEQQLTCPISSIPKIDEMISIAVDIEESRDDLAYGSPVKEEEKLMEKINQLLYLKKLIEEQVGELDETK